MNMKAPAQPIDPLDAPFVLPAIANPWGEPLLAALPHIWVALSVVVSVFLPASNPDSLRTPGTLSLIVFILVCLGVALYAWRHAWPLWSASWMGYAAWVGVVLAGLLASRLGNDNWIINAVLIFGALGGIALAYLFLFRSSRTHALLLALFLMPVATQWELEAIPDNLEAFIALLFGLLAAGVAVVVVRTLSWRVGVVFAIAANLVSGAVLTYISFYQAEIPGFYGDSFSEALAAFLVYAGLAVMLYLGPPIFWWILRQLSSAASHRPRQENNR
jgi:uncharacterized membrane protein